jgi:hypothetical protein
MEAIGKTCSKCGRVDPECGFFPNRRRCKDCYRESNREQMHERRKDPAAPNSVNSTPDTCQANGRGTTNGGGNAIVIIIYLHLNGAAGSKGDAA